MKSLLYIGIISALLAFSSNVSGTPASESHCLSCHKDFEGDTGPAHDFEKDIHLQNGIGCYDCHGGDPKLDDMDAVRASAGFRGVPDRLAIPEFCARCHSNATYMHEHNPSLPVDQLDKYKTSVHGMKLMKNKDRKVATCVSCHTAHRIGDARMPQSSTYPANVPATCGTCHSDAAYMAGYKIPTDQVEKYTKSVHGQAVLVKRDMSAPACNDCHGNHGAAPPEVGSLSAVCGMCHAIEARLYQGSPHGPAFAEQGLPMCETCHSNHDIEHPTDALIGLGDNQLCANCHTASDDNQAPRVIDSLKTGFATLTNAVDSARLLVQEAGDRGMMISDEEFALKDIDQLLIQTRSFIHSFSIDTVGPKLTEGVTKAKTVQAEAIGLVDEYHFRRWGLGIASGIITLLALLLYLKIRTIEKP